MKTQLMVKQAGIIILIFFAAFFFLIKPMWSRKSGLLEKKLKERHALIKEYTSGKTPPPSTDIYNLLLKHKESLEEDSSALSELIDPPRVPLPDSVLEPRLYFKERLYILKKRLDDDAAERKMELPANLGFSEELPEPGEVELLLRRLETVSNLVNILIEKNATSIGLIKPLEPIEILDPQTNQPAYLEMPIRLELECPTKTLVDFLYEVNKGSPILVVKELRVRSIRAKSLEVETLISEIAVE